MIVLWMSSSGALRRNPALLFAVNDGDVRNTGRVGVDEITDGSCKLESQRQVTLRVNACCYPCPEDREGDSMQIIVLLGLSQPDSYEFIDGERQVVNDEDHVKTMLRGRNKEYLAADKRLCCRRRTVEFASVPVEVTIRPAEPAVCRMDRRDQDVARHVTDLTLEKLDIGHESP